MLETLALEFGAKAGWLDRRNASLALVLPPQGLSVQVLLGLQRHRAITALVNSRDGMGHGAVQTRRCFEHLPSQLQQRVSPTQLLDRSDRDGPIQSVVVLSSAAGSTSPPLWRRHPDVRAAFVISHFTLRKTWDPGVSRSGQVAQSFQLRSIP